MHRLLFLAAITACGHSHPDRADARPAPDTPGMADAPGPLDAAPDAPGGFVIPATDLGMLTVPGTCTDTYRGWSLDDANACTANNHTSSGLSSRQITIASDGTGGYQMSTMLIHDPYTVTLSHAQPAAQQVSNVSCNPIYGTCIEHDWTLAAHSLVLVTHSLHDNSSSTPLPQCWEYYYEKIAIRAEGRPAQVMARRVRRRTSTRQYMRTSV
jgi:hypothetical protein